MAVPFTEFKGTQTIGSTVRSLPADTTVGVPTAQTTAGRLSGLLDLSAVAAGDAFTIKIYEKVNGGSQALVDTWYIAGAQPGLWPIPDLAVNEGWDITIEKTAGTDRSIGWNIKLWAGDVSVAQWRGTQPNALSAGRVDATIGAAQANTLTASALAADAVTEIQSGLATTSDVASVSANVGIVAGAVADVQTSVDALPTASASAAATWATVLDANAPVNAQTALEIMNIVVSVLAAIATGLDGPSVDIKSTGGGKSRVTGDYADGARTNVVLDGSE